jgi:hypothetical protein
MAGTVLHVNVDRCMTMWPKARDNDNGPLVQAASARQQYLCDFELDKHQ